MTNSTNNKDVKNVLESLILVSLADIHGISGRKKLKRSDLGKDVELPPDVLVSLGSKKVIDPTLLNPFNQYKNKAHGLCSAVGIRFLGGYAVPADRVNELLHTLNDIKSEFYIYKKNFLQSDFTRWVEECDEKYRSILLDGKTVDIEYMDSQIQFGFTAIHITPYGNSVIQDGLTEQVKSLSDEVFEDVANVVEGFIKNLNKTAFTQHTLNPLRRTADKLRSLSFISDTVNSLANYVTDVLSDVPDTGKVTGRKYSDIVSLLNNLRYPAQAKSFVELLNSDKTDATPDVDLALVPVHETPDNSSTNVATPDEKLVSPKVSVPDVFIAPDAVVVDSDSFSPTGLKFDAEESAARDENGFATDLPSGKEVIAEPSLTQSVEENRFVSSAPDTTALSSAQDEVVQISESDLPELVVHRDTVDPELITFPDDEVTHVPEIEAPLSVDENETQDVMFF